MKAFSVHATDSYDDDDQRPELIGHKYAASSLY